MSSSSSFSNSSTSSDQSPTIQQRDIRKMSMPVSCLEHDVQLLRDKRSTNSRSTRSADRSPVRSEHRGEWKLDSPTSARNSKESNRYATLFGCTLTTFNACAILSNSFRDHLSCTGLNAAEHDSDVYVNYE